MRAAFATTAFLALAGCDMLFPEDPRQGVELEEQCLARVASELRDEAFEQIGSDNSLWIPIYTYDVTKLSLDAIKELAVTASDETIGTRISQSTNETSTAVDSFMAQDIDEDGAFFFGRDPSLYRVRGEAVPLTKIILAGCERQQPNMRLIKVDFTRAPDPSETDANTSTQTESK